MALIIEAIIGPFWGAVKMYMCESGLVSGQWGGRSGSTRSVGRQSLGLSWRTTAVYIGALDPLIRQGHMVLHCKKLLQMLPVEVAVILQYYCESTATYCERTVKFLNLQLFLTKYYMNFGEFTLTFYSVS